MRSPSKTQWSPSETSLQPLNCLVSEASRLCAGGHNNNNNNNKFDDTLRSGLSTILNIDLSEDQWLQASLPVRDGGLGIRSAQMLAPSAFLASAASTFQLQQSILPDTISSLEDASVESIEAQWVNMTDLPEPDAEERHIQKAWDGQVTRHNRELILRRASTDVDKARLHAASSPHSGDWLHAPPISTVGLRLSDEAIRVAVAHRLGCRENQLTHVGYMGYLAVKAHPDNSVTST